MSGGAEPIAIVILAAGASRRMGVAKQLLRHRGHTLLRHAVDAALDSSCRPVVVVLGANAEAVQPEVEGLRVQIVWNAHWPEGLSTSIRAVFPELMALDGDTGAKQVIQRHAASVWPVPCPQGAVDLDTPEDYDTLRPRATP